MTCGVTGLGGELMTRTKDHNNHNQLSQLIVKPNQIVNPYFFGTPCIYFFQPLVRKLLAARNYSRARIIIPFYS